jgi:hypothetical protein
MRQCQPAIFQAPKVASDNNFFVFATSKTTFPLFLLLTRNQKPKSEGKNA